MKENKQEHDSNKAAVALSYTPEEEAPKVVATGKGYLAEKILEVAKENNVPIHEDKKVAGVLSKLGVGEYIPQELYEVVAEILVFVDNMDNIKSKLDKAK